MIAATCPGTQATGRLRRTMDATHLNLVANHPEVRPWIGGEGLADLQPILDAPHNVALESAHGGFIAVRLEDDLYECHSLFLPEGRGVETMHARAEAARYFFTATPARTLVTRVPARNRAALGLARAAGFERQFTRIAAWPDGSDVGFWALSIERWAQRVAETYETGRAFHRLLDEAKRAQHSQADSHPEDPIHDAMVGLAIVLAYSGQPAKSLAVYNRWARIAGYVPIELVTWDPFVVDIGDALVQLKDQTVEVLRLCRH